MARIARNEQQLQRVREAILDAAMRAFARSAYHAVSMKDIAREASYTAPSLYNYFSSKEEIFAALITRIGDEFLAVFEEPIPSGIRLEQRVELLVLRTLHLGRRHRESFMLFMKLEAGGAPNEQLARDRMELFNKYIARLVRWLRDAGMPTDVAGNIELLAYALWGLMHAFQVRALRQERQDDDKALASTLTSLFFHGAAGKKGR